MEWLRGSTETVETFGRASGEPEFYSDGLKVNTTGGWREMRLNLLQKRERAMPAAPKHLTRFWWRPQSCRCRTPYSGRMCGNSSTSRIEGELVYSITSRSTPKPKPAVGGMPYSSART